MIKKLLLLITLVSIGLSNTFAQSLWINKSEIPTNLHAPEHQQMPSKLCYLDLDRTLMYNRLLANETCIDIAMPDGSEACYAIERTQIVADKTQSQRPDLRTYRGVSLDNPLHRVYFVFTQNDFHLIGEGTEGVFFIDQVKNGDETAFISFWGKDDVLPNFHCDLIEQSENENANLNQQRNQAPTSWGTELRKFRAAILWTNGHVANYSNDTTALVNRSIEIVNDMNFVLERDLCITYELAINPELLIFPDAATDPYNGLGSITGIINNKIGSGNFEIGQAIAGGGGGVSYLGVTCDGAKAGTQSSNDFWVIVHEWGHNMGADHTFNYCPGWGGSGIEPGAGNSIMSYGGSGVCGEGHQVPGGRINYFHSISVQSMYNRLFLNTNCSENIPTGNTPPTITSSMTGGFTIPKATPFVLTASATDAEDASNLTYSWEQYQWGVNSNPNAPTADDPIFRMFPFSSAPTRTIPRIDEIINGYNYGEILPEESRTLNFRLSVRDNHLGGSGITYDNMEFLVDENAGPFEVLFPNDNMIFGSVGQTRTITWDVANTDVAPVNCALVDVFLSTDGGYTYPITLASGITNNGSATITIPDAIGTTNRIRIQAADNIFFDISDKDFEIVAATTNDFTVSLTEPNQSICNETSIDYQLDLFALGVFTNTVDLAWAGLPTGATLTMPSNVNGTSSTTITISNLDAVALGYYPMSLLLNESGGGVSKSISLELTLNEDNLTPSPDQAMSFNGSSWIHIPKNNSDFDFGDERDFSLEFWTKTTSTSGDDALISDKNWDSGNNAGWVVFMQNGAIGFNAGENGASNRVDIGSGGQTYNDGEWHHVAVIWTRTGNGLVQLFVDGVLLSQKSNANVGSIDNDFDIVIGADKDNDYAYEGQIDEVRFWQKALTANQIRESMHLVWETCDTDLISCYQFNETSGAVLDAFSHHDGVVTNAQRMLSSAPFGKGFADTQNEMNGFVAFLNTDLSLDYTKHADAEVVATKINLPPYGATGLEAGDVVLDQQYWVINDYHNNGSLSYNAQFILSEMISAAETATPFIYKLYHRPFNSDTDWTLITNAFSANDTNNSLLFNAIPTYGQFVIAKNTGPTITNYTTKLAFCDMVFGDESELLSYQILGTALTNDILVSAPANFEISLDQTTFSNSLTLAPATGAVATTIYVRFVPNVEGDFTGIITHTSTGSNTTSLSLEGTSVIPRPYQAMTFDGTGTIHISKTTDDFNFGADRDFSIDFWTKTTTTSGDATLISDKDWDSGGNAGWVLAMQSGGFVFNAGSSGNRVDIGTGSVNYNDGEWHHVAVSFSRSADLLQIYVDGHKKNERNLTGTNLANINTDLDIVIGADGTNSYGYAGTMEEVRIWRKALTETEVREHMHLIYTGCHADMIANFHLDEPSGDVVDTISGFTGTVTNATSVLSSAPIGPGVARTQGEMNGLVSFTPTKVDADYTLHASASITASHLHLMPYEVSGIDPTDELLNTEYWILNQYENTGDLNFDATFQLDASIPVTTNYYKLYGRAFNSDSNWVLLADASSADAALNTVTFEDITSYGQYVITRSLPTFRVTETVYNNDVCKSNDIKMLFEMEAVFGYVPSNPVAISVSGEPAGTTTVLSTNQVDLNAAEPVLLTFENTAAATGGVYNIIVDFTDGTITQSKTIDITIGDNTLEGTAGTAMTFDGSGDIIDVGNEAALDFSGTKNFTFEVWIKPSVANASGHFISKYNRFIVGQYFFGMENGVVQLQREVAPYTLSGTTQLEANKWYHLAGTYDGTDMKIYINGELEASQVSTGSTGSSSTAVTIGGAFFNNSYGYFLNAEMDELRVWNRARTQQEIREHRHLILSSCEDDLIANFQFNELTGDVICPISGITGTLNGDATRTIASEPIGRGYSYTNPETAGQTPFYFTDCNIDFAATTNTEAVVSKIDNAPYNTISLLGQTDILDDQYWVLNRYGVDAFLGDLTLYPSEVISAFSAANPTEFALYGRNSNEFDDWTLITLASNVDATTNAISFQNVTTFGQYTITRTETDWCPPSESYSGNVLEGIYQTSVQITSTGLIEDTENVEFKSDCIKLEAGFEVQLGAEFLAVPEPCIE